METQRCGSCKQALPLGSFSPSYRGKAGTWCRGCFAAYNRGEPRTASQHEPRQCENCRQWYVPVILRGNAKYCSPVCKGEARRAEQAAARLAAKAQRKCVHCAGPIPPNKRADVRYCSSRCAQRQRSTDGREFATRRKHHLKRSYGLTEVEFDGLLEAQGGKCAVCGSPDPRQKDNRWSVDHCHDTGAVRGLLCGPCNTGIGQLADDPARLRAAADYLERSRAHA